MFRGDINAKDIQFGPPKAEGSKQHAMRDSGMHTRTDGRWEVMKLDAVATEEVSKAYQRIQPGGATQGISPTRQLPR